MKTIHKYRFEWELSKQPVIQEIKIPVGSGLIRCGVDARGEDCIWFEQPLNEKRMMKFQFAVVGTGQQFTLHGFEFHESFISNSCVLFIYLKY
jgi:hypothetical protein